MGDQGSLRQFVTQTCLIVTLLAVAVYNFYPKQSTPTRTTTTSQQQTTTTPNPAQETSPPPKNAAPSSTPTKPAPMRATPTAPANIHRVTVNEGTKTLTRTTGPGILTIHARKSADSKPPNMPFYVSVFCPGIPTSVYSGAYNVTGNETLTRTTPVPAKNCDIKISTNQPSPTWKEKTNGVDVWYDYVLTGTTNAPVTVRSGETSKLAAPSTTLQLHVNDFASGAFSVGTTICTGPGGDSDETRNNICAGHNSTTIKSTTVTVEILNPANQTVIKETYTVSAARHHDTRTFYATVTPGIWTLRVTSTPVPSAVHAPKFRFISK